MFLSIYMGSYQAAWPNVKCQTIYPDIQKKGHQCCWSVSYKSLDCWKTISNLSFIQLINKTILKCCKFNIYYRAVANIFTSRKRVNTLVGMASIIINMVVGGGSRGIECHPRSLERGPGYPPLVNLLKFRTI